MNHIEDPNTLDEVLESKEAKPEPHLYEFSLISPTTQDIVVEHATGFLYVTSAFIGVGVGDGEVTYVAPLDNIFRVRKIEGGLDRPKGNA